MSHREAVLRMTLQHSTWPAAPSRRSAQRGNALVLALLALVLAATAALSTVQGRLLEIKSLSGRAEATVLETLRGGANNAMLHFMFDIQAGKELVKHVRGRPDIKITPTLMTSATESTPFMVWKPKLEDLAAMDFLPSGWKSTTTSVLNNAPYEIVWRRAPGCVTNTCNIEGWVVLKGAIIDPQGPAGNSDGVVIGPILEHFGADGGVSLQTAPGVITGYGTTWELPNPVPGNPPGVVAVRFGTNSSLTAQYVRIHDPRDPDLAGNLTVAKDVTVGGKTTLKGEMRMLDSAGNPCFHLSPNGQVVIGCEAKVTVTDGTPGNTTTVSPTEVKATGRITGGDVVATKNLAGQRLVLPDVAEGAACGAGGGSPIAGSEYAGLADGGLAFCSGGRWLAINRFRATGAACAAAEEGAVATDLTDRQGLICRHGVYLRASALMSNFVLVQTVEVPVTTTPVTVAKPQCPSAGAAPGAVQIDPLIILTANNEDAPVQSAIAPGLGSAVTSTLSGINRYATETTSNWTVHLERSSDGAVLPGTLIASIYCWYH